MHRSVRLTQAQPRCHQTGGLAPCILLGGALPSFLPCASLGLTPLHTQLPSPLHGVAQEAEGLEFHPPGNEFLTLL